MLFRSSGDTVSMGTKENADQIRQFLKDIHRVENAIEYAEAELGYEFPADCFLNVNDEKTAKITTFIDKTKEIEYTSWNRAMDNLRDNLQSWWD